MGKRLNVGIVRFPGSNCDFDTFRFFEKYGHNPRFVWHKERKIKGWDILVLPGGFAFGDRVYEQATGSYSIDPGVMALNSPVMDVVYMYAQSGRPILGICNGFQILVKAGLLPGSLQRNEQEKFFCDFVLCKVVGRSFFGERSILGGIFNLPVAHGYGKYVIDGKTHEELSRNKQISLLYEQFNPNGSCFNIAGVCNRAGTIFGMMPHPERSYDGKYFMEAIERYVMAR